MFLVRVLLVLVGLRLFALYISFSHAAVMLGIRFMMLGWVV